MKQISNGASWAHSPGISDLLKIGEVNLFIGPRKQKQRHHICCGEWHDVDTIMPEATAIAQREGCGIDQVLFATMMEAIIDEYDDNTAALYGAAFVKSLSKHYKEDMSAIDVIATIVDGRNRGYVVNNKSNGNLLYVVIDATNTFFDWIRMPMGTGKLQIRY